MSTNAQYPVVRCLIDYKWRVSMKQDAGTIRCLNDPSNLRSTVLILELPWITNAEYNSDACQIVHGCLPIDSQYLYRNQTRSGSLHSPTWHIESWFNPRRR